MIDSRHVPESTAVWWWVMPRYHTKLRFKEMFRVSFFDTFCPVTCLWLAGQPCLVLIPHRNCTQNQCQITNLPQNCRQHKSCNSCSSRHLLRWSPMSTKCTAVPCLNSEAFFYLDILRWDMMTEFGTNSVLLKLHFLLFRLITIPFPCLYAQNKRFWRYLEWMWTSQSGLFSISFT